MTHLNPFSVLETKYQRKVTILFPQFNSLKFWGVVWIVRSSYVILYVPVPQENDVYVCRQKEGVSHPYVYRKRCVSYSTVPVVVLSALRKIRLDPIHTLFQCPNPLEKRKYNRLIFTDIVKETKIKNNSFKICICLHLSCHVTYSL